MFLFVPLTRPPSDGEPEDLVESEEGYTGPETEDQAVESEEESRSITGIPPIGTTNMTNDTNIRNNTSNITENITGVNMTVNNNTGIDETSIFSKPSRKCH